MPEETKVPEEKSLVLKKLEEAGLTKKNALPTLEGLENVSRSDIATPIYILAQPTSNTYGNLAGKFVDKGTGIPQDDIQCVLLKLIKTRNLWPKPYNPGDERICWSKDSWKPSGEMQSPQETICAEIDPTGREIVICPQAAFGLKGEAPSCHITYSFLAFDIRMNTPFLISFKGKSIKPVKQLINQFIRKQKSLWSAIITISTVKPEDLGMPKGAYHIAKFQIDWAETETELTSLKSLYDLVSTKKQEQTEEKGQAVTTHEEAVSSDQKTPF